MHQAIATALKRIPIKHGAKIVIGVSGGADSTALLHAMIELRGQFGGQIAAAHLNHRLRGAESDRDENFVREMCAGIGVELIVERAAGLDAGSSNLEERAREARHNFLNRAADALGAEHIALAHHSGDQAETVLMRLIRGAGASGLGAMSERGPGRLIRPMLALSRADIIGYLRELDLAYIEDATNSSPIFLRNRIRNELIPLLEGEYAIGVGKRLVELAAEMRSLDELVTAIASREIDSMRAGRDALDIAHFGGLHRAVQAAVIRNFIGEQVGDLRRFGRVHIDAIMRLAIEGGPSDSIDLPNRWRACREYNLLRLTDTKPKSSLDYSVALCFEGATIVDAAGFVFQASTMSVTDARLPASPSIAMFDAGAIGESGLMVRNFSPGDRIRPLGMTGVKKVKNVFIDRKMPRTRRSSYPIITMRGEPVWIPGLMRGTQAPIDITTETVLRIESHETKA
ncbi:MAG: tRNA lysidine(34) synthetase TilS [Candidatus Binatus sp.]|uniref:tRNA lysidine(34) synthetase TilS n=1 Tax=Candidatus Binatus sp. TaxID=2811406 RepID=UPI0027190C6C|nr:tRNA lysidine(34) synthetase TilS [Candidatus Binatus sp.]MDO8434823.1 tRNA lysidine(34) synthetase TilS [Candidatus Binatus sp.]